MSQNIREYNFAIPGNTERHIPGIPGTWPFGSRVQVNEDNQVVGVWPEGAEPVIPGPAEKEQETKPVPDAPPALEKSVSKDSGAKLK